MRDYTVVVNDCAAPPVPGILHIRTRQTAHGPANFTYTYDGIVKGLPRPLTPAQQDWLEVFGALFAADLACLRGPETDWNRRLNVHIPVRDPAAWACWADSLADLFAELTYDDLRLEFHQDADPAVPPRQQRTPFADFDAVALFSGGMDSFVGAAQLVADGRVPALLTHSSGSAIPTATRLLRSGLSRIGALGPSLTLTAQRRTTVQVENSQRSRSLLFLAAAALVATADGVTDVFINENGVMAVHAPMTAARVGSLSTRTASPTLLDTFTEFATTVLAAPVTMRNLLQAETKPEVVGRARGLGIASTLANTISCWAIARNRRHCGYCAPCLIRRISMETHGVLDTLYDANPFDGDRAADPVAHDNLVQLLMLAQDLTELPEVEIQFDYPEVLNTGSTMTLADSLAMHRRWGQQALAVARAHPYAAGLL